MLRMRKYRIVQTKPDRFIIQQKMFLFGWVDVSTPTGLAALNPNVRPLTTLQQARDRVARWRKLDSFVPVVYDADAVESPEHEPC